MIYPRICFDLSQKKDEEREREREMEKKKDIHWENYCFIL